MNLQQTVVERAPPATFYKQVTFLIGVTINKKHCTHLANQLIAGENND